MRGGMRLRRWDLRPRKKSVSNSEMARLIMVLREPEQSLPENSHLRFISSPSRVSNKNSRVSRRLNTLFPYPRSVLSSPECCGIETLADTEAHSSAYFHLLMSRY